MGSQRSLLRSIKFGTAQRLHKCKSNSKHVLAKGDPMLVIKIDRNVYHYCGACALAFIATARSRLAELEDEFTHSAREIPHAS